MTLCIVWRIENNVCFASDSRLSFENVACDAAIKIHRLPYRVYGPRNDDETADVLADGDFGAAFAGPASVALMTKDAIAEVVRDLVGVPGHHDFGMDGLSDIVFRGFKVVAGAIAPALFEKVSTCAVFTGFCKNARALRSFRMEVSRTNEFSIAEVLRNPGDIELFGSGASAARKLLPPCPGQKDILEALQGVIEDDSVPGVGGSIQYGQFNGQSFQVYGTMRHSEGQTGIHYWRGPLDLNGDAFDQATGLVPRLPYLDMLQH